MSAVRGGDTAEIIGDRAPGDPADHALLAPIAAPTQVSPPEPGLLLRCSSCCTNSSCLWNGLHPHVRIPGSLLAVLAPEPAIGCQTTRRMTELSLMNGKTRVHLLGIRCIARQHLDVRDNPALALSDEHLAAELGLGAGLVAADDRCVRFKHADDLLSGRHTLPRQTPLGLPDHLLGPLHHRLQPVAQARCVHTGQARDDLTALPDHGPGDPEQFPIAVPAGDASGLSSFPGALADRPGPPSRTPHPAPEDAGWSINYGTSSSHQTA